MRNNKNLLSLPLSRSINIRDTKAKQKNTLKQQKTAAFPPTLTKRDFFPSSEQLVAYRSRLVCVDTCPRRCLEIVLASTWVHARSRPFQLHSLA